MARSFLVRIDAGDGLPIYRQIVEQVKAAIAAGALVPGDRVPSHRDLAREIVVAPLTVSRAYDVLEREGILVTERGRGTFVAPAADRAVPAAEEELKERTEALIRQARVLGMSRREVLEALRRTWEEEGKAGEGECDG
jgi:GntR family transcriptional regulator